MKSSAPPTVQCPKCQQQLPGWAQSCQFCGTPLAGVQRPPDAFKYAVSNKKSWQEICYKIVSVYWLLTGIGLIIEGAGLTSLGALGALSGQYEMVFGIVNVVLGVGLLAEWLWAQFLVKIISYLNILGGLIMFVMAFGGRHGHIFFPAAYNLFTAVLAAFTIYLMQEYGDA